MDHSWHHHRPPPPPGGAPPCPVCSMCHFPFCPPPFPQNYPIHHQYPPPHPDQFYPRPPQLPPPHTPSPPAYDPFLDNAGGPFTNPHRPPWTTNSGFDRDPHGNMYSNSYFSNVGAKRMRFDDWGFSSSPARLHLNENSGNSSEALAEDERRLKLIRDHGGEMSGEPRNFDGRSDMSTLNRLEVSNPFDPDYGDFDGKLKFFSQDSIVEHKQSDRSVEHGQLRHNQVDNSLHQKNVYDYTGNSFDDIEQPRQSYEAMGYNWQGVSGKNAVYDDQRNGFGREYQTLDNEFVHKYAMHHDTEPKRNQYGLHSTYLNNQSGKNMGLPQGSWVFNSQPPLPASPPPPLPMEPLRKHLVKPVVSSSPSGTSASLFPIASGSSTAVPSSYTPVSQSSSLAPAYHPNRGPLHASTGFGSEELQAIQQAPYKAYFRGSEVIPQQPRSPDQPKVIDASHIIKHPHRATRPDHIVIILRGLPGSGKSYLAKMLRDLEVENGGNVPRIHSMDDYFMTEVEKVEESEVPKTSGIVRGKRPVTKKIIEYCFEPEMEEAYRSSMLKAFKKTLDEGVFSFVIVDDRNLRVADFAQFWATAKRSGYEVYLLEATYKDPAGCAARNVHGFTQDDIQNMADLWEEAPTLYLKLDIKSLLHGDGFEESGIQEVDMDMEDGDPVGGLSGSEERNVEKLVVPNVGELVSDGPLKDDERWDAEADHRVEEVKELGKSKWSNDLDEDDIHKKDAKGNLTALSGLNQFFSKEGKSVRWGDQVRNSGFSIAATKTANIASLVIGPGAGYNLKSNPLLDEEKMTASLYRGESKKQSVFQDQLRAEHESFKAVFDKRKQRISGLNGDQD